MDRHLDMALDLLLDGETGLWLWNGRAFAPMAAQPMYARPDVPAGVLR